MIQDFLSYSHKEINSNSFIFPITGLVLKKDSSFKVGNVNFVDKEYLQKNIVHIGLFEVMDWLGKYKNVTTFAIVDLDKFGDYDGLCETNKGGNNSLALQLLKQAIGAIYLSVYNLYTPRYDVERRIIISDKGVHEVDEGLNDYMFFDGDKYINFPNETSQLLITYTNNFDLNNINDLINIMKKDLKKRSDLENKICKSLEIIYSIYTEPYTVERVIKLVILLNYIFRESNEHKFDSTHIGRKLRILFNIISTDLILETIPSYMYTKQEPTAKISNVIIDIYSRVRNDVMHGKMDLYTEYAVINLDDYIPLKVAAMELLNIIVKTKGLRECKDTKAMNEYIELKEKERIDKINAEKSGA